MKINPYQNYYVKNYGFPNEITMNKTLICSSCEAL